MVLRDGKKCPVCFDGNLRKCEREERFNYKGMVKVLTDYPVYVCNACDEEIVDPNETKAFEKELTNFKRQVDGLLTSQEIKEIRQNLGFTQTGLARVLRVGEKNFARYESGLVTQGSAIDNTLRILRDHPETLNVLLQEKRSINLATYKATKTVSMTKINQINKEKMNIPSYSISDKHIRSITCAKGDLKEKI